MRKEFILTIGCVVLFFLTLSATAAAAGYDRKSQDDILRITGYAYGTIYSVSLYDLSNATPEYVVNLQVENVSKKKVLVDKIRFTFMKYKWMELDNEWIPEKGQYIFESGAKLELEFSSGGRTMKLLEGGPEHKLRCRLMILHGNDLIGGPYYSQLPLPLEAGGNKKVIKMQFTRAAKW